MDKHIFNLFEDKTIVVTGGLGSIGIEIVNQLLQYNPKEIRVIDNRETELYHLKQQFDSNIVTPIYGDIRDEKRVSTIIEGSDIVFHAAAMKHVPICEYNPFEAVKTNVIGTQNIINASIRHKVDRMILISTDKAVNPTNVMGATKLLAERLVVSTCYEKKSRKTKFGVVRFGNVIGSRGSVLDIWANQLARGKKITITNPEMTRFFMDITESVRLIFEATYYAENGEIFILKMPSVKIGDLAEVFLEIKGYSPEYYIITGMRAGEKLHEELMSQVESRLLLEKERLLAHVPLIFAGFGEYDQTPEYQRLVSLGFKKAEITSFMSNNPDYLLNKQEIEPILKKILTKL